jgi:hypothetical protein
MKDKMKSVKFLTALATSYLLFLSLATRAHGQETTSATTLETTTTVTSVTNDDVTTLAATSGVTSLESEKLVDTNPCKSNPCGNGICKLDQENRFEIFFSVEIV